ncbi:hypothetical protein G1H11_10950 [Phytoactinopolyspora alkaliphila]|uniref:Uncharacterized protein n=1 Tax=Phytoactinopolyspora alkaliphila TaxID=1783498 RepID=A0A6N9YL79_9ACTN|nr:hypothetical protein [Phytoactinopolyspora alkaliphila]NED95831.1 hypothetical protein [Phytoactinopolyspora alkaliphila]
MAALSVLSAATLCACSLTESALDEATSSARWSASSLQANLSDVAPRGHAEIKDHIERHNRADQSIRYGDYLEINPKTGAVDAVVPSRTQTGGGLFAEDETVVLCVTFLINLAAGEVSIVDTACPDEIRDPGYDNPGEYDVGSATEVTLEDE